MNRFFRTLLAILCVLSLFVPSSLADEDSAASTTTSSWMNILLLGSDERVDTEQGRTDTMIILSVNLRTGQIKLASIMRDTWVSIPGHGSQKINAANRYGGPELAMQTVNNCFGTDITHYVLVNMFSLADAIDAIGGIDLAITSSELSYINRQIKYSASHEGVSDDTPLSEYGDNIHLNGTQAVAYARIRKLDSDYQRTQRQRNVILAIVEKARGMSLPSLIALASSMLGTVYTNLNASEILTIAGVCLTAESGETPQMRLPADGTYTAGMNGDVWRIDCNFKKNAEILSAFIYSDDWDAIPVVTGDDVTSDYSAVIMDDEDSETIPLDEP